ncbi:MAG: hypothetical protein RLO12_19005, partial [Fulvivirga sp.]
KRKRGYDSLKENLGRSKVKRVYKYKKASKKDLWEINQRMKLRNERVLIKQILVITLLGVIFAALMFYLFFTPTKHASTLGKPLVKDYYSTETRPLGNNIQLKIEYFDMGSIAATTKMKNGYKHQQSESWYPNGKQFRFAVYWYDTLINEVYFAPSGDTLKNSPILE